MPPYLLQLFQYARSELKYLDIGIAFLCQEWYAMGEGRDCPQTAMHRKKDAPPAKRRCILREACLTEQHTPKVIDLFLLLPIRNRLILCLA